MNMEKNKNYFDNFILNYANFSGRATREDFWVFQAILLGISLIFGIVETLFQNQTQIVSLLSNLSGLFNLFVLIPSISIGARRLHDTGKTGWWQLLMIVPIIGWIILFIYYILASSKEENKYGKPAHL
jgi:uncharacterized membrane protein YhaH (DUF805 family)